MSRYQKTPDHGEDPNWAKDGYGNAIHDEEYSGKNAYDRSVDEYQRRGRERQDPITLDQTQADQSRGLQMGALEMLRRQGSGEAPSSAAILSQRANENAAHAIGAGGLRHGGIAGALQGQTQATQAAVPQAMAANAANANMRAGEISHGQGAYAAGTVGAEGQDIGAATTNAQLEAQQHALDQAHQQFYEKMGYNVRRTQASARAESIRQVQQKYAQDKAYMAARSAADWNNGKYVVGVGLTAGMSVASSGGGGGTAADVPPARAAGGPVAAGHPYLVGERGPEMVMPTHMGVLGALRRGGR